MTVPLAAQFVALADRHGTVGVDRVVLELSRPNPNPAAVEQAPVAAAASSSDRVVATPVAAAAAPTPGAPRVTPLVRRIAATYGVDLTRVTGTGAGGRIRKADVLAAAGDPEAGGDIDDATADELFSQPAAQSRAAAPLPPAPAGYAYQQDDGEFDDLFSTPMPGPELVPVGEVEQLFTQPFREES